MQCIVCHATVMKYQKGLILLQYVKHSLNFVRLPDIVLVSQKYEVTRRSHKAMLKILHNSLPWSLKHSDSGILKSLYD
nr:hypothetical protein [Faecalibaculum rodentium]